MDQVQLYLEKTKDLLGDVLELLQPYIDSVAPVIEAFSQDFLKAVASWDYITISIFAALIVAAIPSFLWIGA